MIRQELGGTRDRCRMSPVQLPSYCLSAPDPPFQALLCDAGAGILETIYGFASSPLLVSAKWGGCPGRSCKPGRGKGTALPVSFHVIPESITPASHVHLGHACFFLSLPGAYQVALVVKKKKICPPFQETQKTGVQSLGWEDPLEKEMATHSSILAWKIPWAEEPGQLQPLGSQRFRLSRAHTPTFLPVTPAESSLQGFL